MSVTSQITDRVHEAQDAITRASANAAAKAASFAEDVSAKVDNADAALATVAQQSRDVAEKAKTATEDFMATVENRVRKQPITALLLAIAGGFLVGAMWKTRS